jgi:FMN-dependent NADH-azoreductase
MLSDDQMSESDASIKALRNGLVDQLLSVDTVVVSVPVWNYGVPAALKAYIDLVGVIGRTWKMENHQYIGLVTNVTNTVVVMSAGGM